MENSSNQKIVVTSVGVSSPVGYSLEDFKKHLFTQNRSEHLTNVDVDKLLEVLEGFEKVDPRRMDRLSLIAVLAAVSCFQDSGITINENNKEDIGGIFSTVFGPVSSARDFIYSGLNNKQGIKNASPLIFPYTVGNAASGIITIFMKAIGFNTTLNSDNPVSYAYEVLKNKKAKGLLVGGYEEIPVEVLEAFKNRKVKLPSGEKIEAKVDTLTEGSAMVFMETEELAKERNADILFEICGYGLQNNLQDKEESIDNFGFISPDSIYKSASLALERSNIRKEDISLIVSLSREDSQQTESELDSLKRIWDDSLPPVFYVKKIFGESFGSNDTFATISGYLKALELKKVSSEPKYVLINSYHMGGNCYSLIIKV